MFNDCGTSLVLAVVPLHSDSAPESHYVAGCWFDDRLDHKSFSVIRPPLILIAIEAG